MNKYLKQIFQTQFFSIINIIIGFLNLFFLIKFLPQTEYGEYVLIQGVISISGLLFSQNLFIYMRLKIAGQDINIQYSYLKTILCIVLLTYIITIFLSVLFNVDNKVISFFEINIKYKFLIICLIFFNILNYEIARFFIAIKKIELNNYFQFLQKTIILLLTIILFYINALTLKSFLFILIISQFIGFLYLSRFLNFNILFKMQLKQDVITKGYKFVLPLIPVGLLSILLNYTDTLMIAKFISKQNVAQYGFASQIINIIMILISSSIILTLFPYATESFNKKNFQEVHKYFMKMYLLGISGALIIYNLIIVNSQFFIQIIGFYKYNQVPNLLLVLGLFPLFHFMYNLNVHYQQLKQKSVIQMYIAILVIIENIILNYFFIQYFGMIGAAYASLLAYVSLAIIYFFISIKNNIEYKKCFFKYSKYFFIPIIISSFIFFLFKYELLNVIILNLIIITLYGIFFIKIKKLL